MVEFKKSGRKADGTIGQWPVVIIAGRKFQQIPKTVWNETFRLFDQLGDDEPAPRPDEVVLWPVIEPDDHLEFKSGANAEINGPLARSGMARHAVFELEDGAANNWPRNITAYNWVGGEKPKYRDDGQDGFTSRQLIVFGEMDWYGECSQVLVAHGWYEYLTGVTPLLASQVEERAPGTVAHAKSTYGEQWSYFVMEIGAIYLCQPLSRLWYAANMMSLYYCHYDDMRLGFLWSEYQMRKDWEAKALKYEAIAEKNRENGKSGGQAENAARRRRVLNDLADSNEAMFHRVLEKTAIKNARSLAIKYDHETGESLFSRRGKLLELKWFADWYAEYCTAYALKERRH